MNRKERFQKIKEMFGMVAKVEKVEEVHLSTISQISKWKIDVEQDSFEVGTKVTYTMEEGDDTVYNVQSGEYVLDNGDKIQVDADGVIVMITPKDGKTEEAPATEEAPVEETVAEKEEVKAEKVEEEVTEENFAETTLKDGVNVQYDSLEVGGHLLIKNGEGEYTAAPAGTYELNDGTIITVNEENLINEVTPGNEVEDEVTIESLVARIDELEKLIEEIAPTFEASTQKVTALENEFTSHKERFEEFANSPFIEQKNAVKNSKEVKLSTADKIKQIKELRNK